MLTALAFLGLAAAGPADPCLKLPAPFQPTMQAAGRPFYMKSEPITFHGKSYVKYGLPRVLVPGDVAYSAMVNGVAVAVDPMAKTHEVVYMLVRMEDCAFQPYQVQK